MNQKVTQFVLPLPIAFFAGLSVLLISFIFNLAWGAADISLDELYQAFFRFDGSTEDLIIRSIRLPRAIVAVMVGSALAVAGCLMQGITKNPLADPSILGINSGAALAVVGSTLILKKASLSTYAVFAFTGATLAAIAVYFFASRSRNGLSPLSLTLAGSAITVFTSAFTSGILILRQRSLEEMRFWLAGSIAGRDLELVRQILPYVSVGLILSLVLAKQITILSLGEETAQGLGQNTVLIKFLALIAIILLAGASVAIAGPVGFMGLIMPHSVRLLIGNDYRWIVPFAMIGGAILLLNADLAGRLILKPQEIPVGLILPILGTPLFIYLIRSRI